MVLAMVGCTSLFGLDVPPNVDRDNDNHRDLEDNCPSVPNQDQSDFDRDGLGDACDECVDGGSDDLDGDGIPDGCDGCVANGSDEDADGIPDNCDGCLESGEDVDGDGMDDACDPCIGKGQDIDGDQIDDVCDDCINTYLDMDADGIDDGCDTCIAGGLDADADGVDDACDPCLSGPQHDEDGDLLYDACDNCPAVHNPDQADSGPLSIDKDGVGDACDNDEASANTQTFDPFTTPAPAWFVQGANWQLGNDAMNYLGGAASYRLLGSASEWFEVRTTLVVDSPSLSASAWASMFIATDYIQPASTRVECFVDLSSLGGATLSIRAYSGGGSEIVAGPQLDLSMPVELVLHVDNQAKTVTCLIGTNKGAEATLPEGGPWLPGIAAAGRNLRFNSFNVVMR